MKNQLLDDIDKAKAEGKITIMTATDIRTYDIADFIKQPTSGILYDLNRDYATAAHRIKQGEVRGVNDYATAVTIEALKARIAELEKQ